MNTGVNNMAKVVTQESNRRLLDGESLSHHATLITKNQIG